MVKRNAVARRGGASERGATLFVVVLVITLLTGVGLYTVHSAGLVAQASGNGRQALQTEHLAQLGALATMSKLVQTPGALTGAQLEARVDPANAEDCSSTRGVITSDTGVPFCLELNSDSPTDFPLANDAALFGQNSFGMAIDEPITGKFQTETTEVDKAGPVAGSSVGSASSGPRTVYYQAKITSVAQLLPSGAIQDAACVENMMQVTGQHITRAHVIVGPISE
jgi:hypothetical protein